jgi:hypothetical protein
MLKLHCVGCDKDFGCSNDRLEKLVLDPKKGPDFVQNEYKCRSCRKGAAPKDLKSAIEAVLAKRAS